MNLKTIFSIFIISAFQLILCHAEKYNSFNKIKVSDVDAMISFYVQENAKQAFIPATDKLTGLKNETNALILKYLQLYRSLMEKNPEERTIVLDTWNESEDGKRLKTFPLRL